MRRIFLSLATLAAPAAAADPLPNIPYQTLTLDAAHSSVTAHVSHLGIAPYVFGFDGVEASLDFGTDRPGDTVLVARIAAGSLDLPSPPEGFVAQILGPGWLDAVRFPAITFTGGTFDRTGPRHARMAGTMRMLGVDAPLVLYIHFHGAALDGPAPRLGFSATGSFERSRFGLTAHLPGSGAAPSVGDRISFRITGEFVGAAQ
ncbi:MAG: YceI family protein [Pseudomonadota bacterium]